MMTKDAVKGRVNDDAKMCVGRLEATIKDSPFDRCL